MLLLLRAAFAFDGTPTDSLPVAVCSRRTSLGNGLLSSKLNPKRGSGGEGVEGIIVVMIYEEYEMGRVDALLSEQQAVCHGSHGVQGVLRTRSGACICIVVPVPYKLYGTT